MQRLLEGGQVLAGKSTRIDGVPDRYTTPEHRMIERSTLDNVARGKGASPAMIAMGEAPARLRDAAGEKPLNGEQIAAGTLALGSDDRTVVIQGVAGAGKTTQIGRAHV